MMLKLDVPLLSKDRLPVLQGMKMELVYRDGLKTDYVVVVNVRTGRKTQDVLPFCLRSILKVFEDNPLEIYVMDDKDDPMDGRSVRWTKKLSPKISYEVVGFPNDDGCAALIAKLREHAAGREVLNLLIEPQTLLFHKTVFDEVFNAPNSAFTAAMTGGKHFSGEVFAFLTDSLDEALRLTEFYRKPIGKDDEDFMLGLILSAASLPRLSAMIPICDVFNPDGGGSIWDYRVSRDMYAKAANIYYNTFYFVSLRVDGVPDKLMLQAAQELLKLVEGRK